MAPETATTASLKIEHCDYVLTLDDQRRILTDASIVVTGNTITAIGKTSDLEDHVADETIDARHFVVTPGFVSGHMHISYAHATRGIFPDDLGRAYLPNVFALQSVMTAEEERLTSLLAITELLKYGTTTLVDPGSTKHIDDCLDAYPAGGVSNRYRNTGNRHRQSAQRSNLRDFRGIADNAGDNTEFRRRAWWDG